MYALRRLKGKRLTMPLPFSPNQGGSDSAYIAPIPENATAGRKGQTLLAVEKTDRFNSELVINELVRIP